MVGAVGLKLAAYLNFPLYCRLKVNSPPPPLHNVEEKYEHVPRSVMHFPNSYLHFYSFYNNITTLYRRGAERVHGQKMHCVPTLLAGIVVLSFVKVAQVSNKNVGIEEQFI